MSQETNKVASWEELQTTYDLEFVEKAIRAYIRSQKYHEERNARINRVIAAAKADGTF
jgi:hypothetical protein